MSIEPDDFQSLSAPTDHGDRQARTPDDSFGIDPRAVRPRASRGPRMVPWVGCPFFSSDDVPGGVPEGTTLRVRLGIYWDGEEIFFARKPFPTSCKPDDVQKRYGPAKYVVQLVTVNPDAPGSGIRGAPLCMKVVEFRPRGEGDVGTEPWPIDVTTPETPLTLIEEMERRKQIRDGGVANGQDPHDFMAGSGSSSMFMNPMGRGDLGPPADGPPGDAPPGFAWSQFGGQWVLMQAQTSQMARLHESPPPLPPPPPPSSPLADLVKGRSVEELIALAAGVVKLVRDVSGGGDNSAASAERIRQEHETRRMELKNENEMFLKRLEAATPPPPPPPPAPSVDVEAIRAAARMEAKLEAMAAEQARLNAELEAAKRAPKEAPPQKPLSLMEELARIKREAELLGLGKKDGAKVEEKPSFLEQIADVLDTQGGRVIAERLASRLIGEDPSSPAAPAQEPVDPQSQEPPQLPDGQ